MKHTGKFLSALLVLALGISSMTALGAVQATLDRDRISMGDTLRLTITATDNDELSEASLTPLREDFQILQRSTSSNTSIVNGRLSQSRQLIVDLVPLREGEYEIPSLQVGGSTTAAIPVVVGPPATVENADQTVVLEAEVDREQVYVQGQVILTLRVLQSVSLARRGISELELENAFVKPLEQHSFQRTINGRPWLVDEIRYAVFPEQSGTLEIPAQTFSGRVSQPRRSLFDLGGGGPQVRRTSPPLTVKVLPRPAEFAADNWLPAQKLELEESWSTPPEELRVGESATRTIRMRGAGTQGAQLPPVLFTPIEGLKFYPDQPRIDEEEDETGLVGIREDSAAVVATKPGVYRIPEIRVPWWDTVNQEMKYAILPAREITVELLPTGNEPGVTPPNTTRTDPIVTTVAAPGWTADPLWPIVAVTSAVGWILTMVYVWRLRRYLKPEKSVKTENQDEKRAFRQLLAACKSNDAPVARASLIRWCATLDTGPAPVSLEQVAGRLGGETLSGELQQLNTFLYGTQQESWSGSRLSETVRQLRNAAAKNKNGVDEPLQLYPAHS